MSENMPFIWWKNYRAIKGLFKRSQENTVVTIIQDTDGAIQQNGRRTNSLWDGATGSEIASEADK